MTNADDNPAGDWADRLAVEIAIDLQSYGTREACGLIAARLRAVKGEGKLEAAQEAQQLIQLALRNPVLQREYQRDVEENGIDGWDPR